MSNKDVQKKESAVPHNVERINEKSVFVPSVDIIEDDNQFKIIADIPGANKDSINVKFEKDILTIQAECPDDGAAGELVYSEYNSGNYERTFRVTEDIDAEKIEANYSKGVLTLTLPKAPSVKPRKIQIKTE